MAPKGQTATEQRRAAAIRGGQATAAKRRAEAAAAATNATPAEPTTATDTDDDAPTFDARKVLTYALNAPHDALAVLTGEDEMRLGRVEREVATSTIYESLELVGWTRFVIYLAPLAAVFVLFAIEGHRVRLMRQWMADRALDRKIAKEAEAPQTFTSRFQEEAPPPAASHEPAPIHPAAGNGSARGLAPDEITYLQEQG